MLRARGQGVAARGALARAGLAGENDAGGIVYRLRDQVLLPTLDLGGGGLALGGRG